ncbi:AraC family transcriptional regulator [Robinsoniella sp.]|uniref:AraC family transcriptional regulator n=2 Tax=Robinsoniella TaxID=588605 RepID=UPI0037514852
MMISVIYCGADSRHRNGFEMERRFGADHYVLLVVKTQAWVELNGQRVETKPNMVLLFDKNIYTHYGSVGNFFNDDWIHFSVTGEKPLAELLEIPYETPLYLSNPEEISKVIQLIAAAFYRNGCCKENVTDALMRSLFYMIDEQMAGSEGTGRENKYFQLMSKVRSKIQNAPYQKWCVEEIAEEVHMSASYFQHLYKELFGISCIQDVIENRISMAKYYLTTTDMPIHALAGYCGYDSDLHFMRQFKKHTGMTPSAYREMTHAHH